MDRVCTNCQLKSIEVIWNKRFEHAMIVLNLIVSKTNRLHVCACNCGLCMMCVWWWWCIGPC